MAPVVDVLAYGTVGLNVLVLIGLVVLGLRRLTGLELEYGYLERLESFLSRKYRELAFLQALVAMSGSLYMSNVLGWTPCRLCWFQRIAIYPLVVLLGTSLVLDREDVKDYVLPLVILGVPISVYHYAIQRVEQFTSAGCSVFAVSCSTEYTFYFGYITVPMMALTALVVVGVLMWRFSGE